MGLVVFVLLDPEEEVATETVEHATDGFFDVEVVDGGAREEGEVLEFEGVVLGLREELVLEEGGAATDVFHGIFIIIM